ncbi:MAG: hypothetical protein R2685_14265 [Candidatus Nitrosocosmicus sp.]|nr:hypothetical protein [Candidatus Nitrosocosmicus sp.]
MIEPIHANICDLCGNDAVTKIHVYHAKNDRDDPTKYTMLLCDKCHDALDNNRQFKNKNHDSLSYEYKKPVLKFNPSVSRLG